MKNNNYSLFVIFVSIYAVCIFYFYALYPYVLHYIKFYFGDTGSFYSLFFEPLNSLTPTIDYAYIYGLLPIMATDGWFALMGKSPQALVQFYIAATAVSAFAAALILHKLQLGRLGQAIVIVAAPVMVNAGHLLLTPAHFLEQMFLMCALAAQLYGRLGLALALATAAVLCKPSLGYFYGLVLLLQIAMGYGDPSPPPLRVRWRWIIPAAAVGLLGATAVISRYGWEPFLRTQFPIEAAKGYQELNHGLFFGRGRELWLPEKWEVWHYFFTIAGSWLTASLILGIGWLVSFRYLHTRDGYFLFTCGLMHILFACLFFGNEWSWIYYPYWLFMGAALAIDRAKRYHKHYIKLLSLIIKIKLLIFIIIVISFWMFVNSYYHWKKYYRSSIVHEFYITRQEERDWKEMIEIARTRRVLVLNRTCAVHVFAPPIEGPRSWVLLRSIAKPQEIADLREKIAAADVLIVPHWHDNNLLKWSELADVLKPFALAKRYYGYDVYVQRTQSP